MIESFRSLVWTDYFLYSLTNFREVYRRMQLDGGRPVMLSFLVPLLVSLTSVVSMSFVNGESFFFYYKISYGILLAYLIEIVQVLVYASFMDGVLQLQGLRGNVKEIAAVLNFAQFPRVFILPVVFFFSTLQFGALFFYAAASFVFFIWYVFNLLQGLSEMHSIDMGKAFAVYSLPVIIIAALGFFILLLSGILLGGYVNSMGI